MFVVTYSGNRGAITRTIGEFEDFEDAEAAARKAGATGKGDKRGQDTTVYAVEGHEDSEDYGIWIEED